MSGDCCKCYRIEVEIQENGIIRDPFGWIIGRCDDDWFNHVVRHAGNPHGLTVSNDGTSINWLGENYVKQDLSRECEDIGGTDGYGNPVFHCSRCGCLVSLYNSEGVNTISSRRIYETVYFGPNCGAEVK